MFFSAFESLNNLASSLTRSSLCWKVKVFGDSLRGKTLVMTKGLSSLGKWLTVWCKPSPHRHFFTGTKLFHLLLLVADIFFTQWANFLVNLAGCTLSPNVHACWVWEWKLRYLESRKSVSCSLWSKSLLLLGLLIPHGAAVFGTHSNNTPLLFSDTRLSFICASCLSFGSHPPSVAGPTPPSFYIHLPPQNRRCSQRRCQCKEKSCLWSQNFTSLTG